MVQHSPVRFVELFAVDLLLVNVAWEGFAAPLHLLITMVANFLRDELAFDEAAGFFIDLFEEAQKAGFEKSLILLRAFNQGEVKVAGRGNRKPANEMSLEEFEKKAA